MPARPASARGPEAPSGAPGTSGAAAGWPPHDPPLDFRSPDTPALPADAMAGQSASSRYTALRPAVMLRDAVAVVGGPSALTAFDMNTGRTLGAVAAKNAAPKSAGGPAAPNAAPRPAAVNGREPAVSAFVGAVPAQGTTAARAAVEVVAMDTAGYGAALDVPLDLPDWANDPNSTSSVGADLVGVSGTTAVVAVSRGDHNAAFAVDLGAGRQLWRHDDFRAFHTADGRVLGKVMLSAADSKLVALDLTDGATAWERPQYIDVHGAHGLGPHLALVVTYDHDRAKDVQVVLNAADGGELRVEDPVGAAFCQYDERSVVVCVSGAPASPDHVTAYDATSGKVLWQLPDTAAHRVVPAVRTVWHGVVYAEVDHKPVLLDAATGADQPGTPRVAALMVDAYFGPTLEQDGTLVAYRTSA
ncbi:PQQ-binding-like beta-propeller repeat protein [Yinghuangia seranimata]|uniref:outer membrane protein assembly factor BamB family protein n=1 Tax=Yinghuangia seranimata TaxID=408067 RepID=UPI00248D097F|nr:PQQ-binding-like beta-propeller repeat protein [Yinghuangia seranimata]MDI2124927.1 PQQ-binding-like beta-propeller repeat protein [Yinghuangia seranimata]